MRPLLRQCFRRWPRKLLAKVGCALVALSVLCAAGQVRTRYFYCEARGLSAIDPCGRSAGQTSPCPFGAIDRQTFDCCSIVTMPTVPQGARSTTPMVPAAGIVGIVPRPGTDGASSSNGRSRVAWEDARWRGPPRSAGERRSQLMVFRT
jgi:hypothetical protein